jgi:hypothetical protein
MMPFQLRTGKMSREEHVAWKKELRKHAKILLEKLQEKKQVVSRICSWDNNIEMDLKINLE